MSLKKKKWKKRGINWEPWMDPQNLGFLNLVRIYLKTNRCSEGGGGEDPVNSCLSNLVNIFRCVALIVVADLSKNETCEEKMLKISDP